MNQFSRYKIDWCRVLKCSVVSRETAVDHVARLSTICGLVLVFTGLVAVAQVAAQIPDVPGWRLTFHDEFDGTALNTTNWEAMDRQNSFNNEKQYYRPEQVTVANGN